MPFDLATWKASVSERLHHWQSAMDEAGVRSVYAYLAAVTLWPVVEAVRGGDRNAAAVLRNIGGTSLIGRVLHCQDAVEGARQLAADLAADPNLRGELDGVLRAIGTLELAEEKLPPAERQWLADALQAEHQPRQRSRRTQARLKGSGAIAQERGVAAGAGGVAVGRDFRGNVYIGSQTRAPAEALAIYRRHLIASYHHLPLQGLDVAASDPSRGQKPLNLAHVYVHLHTTTIVSDDGGRKQGRQRRTPSAEHDPRPLSALQAVITHRQLVLLGNPGSGKSTFLNHLALCLAAHGVDRQGKWMNHLSGWPRGEADLVPVIVALRDFVRWLPPEVIRPEAQHLTGFIKSRLEAHNLEFMAEPLDEMFDQDRAVLLLDGLDEVPTDTQRTLVRDLVARWALRYSNGRMIVTCRTLSYQNPVWQLDGIPAFELAPFDEEQIEHFITAWYDEIV